MMQSLREQSGKWFVKILFGAIIASFGVWGIGDVIRSYSALRPIATIGKQSISYEEFSSALQKEITRLRHLSKGQVTPEQLKQMGIHGHVLDQLIDQAALELEIKRLNLVISDSLIKNQIHAISHFHQNGTFDKNLFSSLLRHNNISEKHFIDDMRKSLLTQQLVAPLMMGGQLPKMYKELLLRALTEERVFTVVSIPFSKVKLKAAPKDEELKISYNQNKAQYAVPESRKAIVVLLDVKTLIKDVPLTPEEIKEEYEKRIDAYKTPEKRNVVRLTYPSMALAEDALAKANTGRPMRAVSRDVKGGEFTDLGGVEMNQLPESAKSVVFSLELGKTSSVVSADGGFSIYQITKIEPAVIKKLDEVRPQIEEALRLQKSGDHIQELKNKIDDAIAGGAKLSDVAKEFKLTIEELSGFDAQGMDEAGKPVLTTLPLAARKSIVEQAFNLNEGTESPISDVDNLSFIVRVEKITPAAVPEFEAVKDKVLNDWTNQKKFEEAAKLADEIVKESKSLADLTKLANKNGLTLTSNHVLTRSDMGEKSELKNEATKALISSFTPDLASKMFQLGVEKSAYGATKDGFSIVMLQRVNPYVYDEKKSTNFNASIDQMSGKILSDLIVDSFRFNHKVSINQETMDHVMSQE
ncbi:MAG: SurA N-terminal domain-containing protein [Alphaproteobacteria bacterium]|nr:SurA N-terminal domain-containing protein [Alphaproteobacteria bacterium]